MSPAIVPDDVPPEADFELEALAGDRVFLSLAEGLIMVDGADNSIWQCDVRGFRITALPEDAVEWLPVPEPPKNLHVYIDGRYLREREED